MGKRFGGSVELSSIPVAHWNDSYLVALLSTGMRIRVDDGRYLSLCTKSGGKKEILLVDDSLQAGPFFEPADKYIDDLI